MAEEQLKLKQAEERYNENAVSLCLRKSKLVAIEVKVILAVVKQLKQLQRKLRKNRI